MATVDAHIVHSLPVTRPREHGWSGGIDVGGPRPVVLALTAVNQPLGAEEFNAVVAGDQPASGVNDGYGNALTLLCCLAVILVSVYYMCLV
ncbi:Vanillyl-alcohol oxidase [Sesbania bispinosa]|nr:Vanillyl-alcohol oxidase [Sesbania bispinosa]